MNRKSKLDTKKTAKALGAEHQGKVAAKSGHFGARQLVVQTQKAAPTWADDPLFADHAVFRGRAPKDVAKEHDADLYGDDLAAQPKSRP